MTVGYSVKGPLTEQVFIIATHDNIKNKNKIATIRTKQQQQPEGFIIKSVLIFPWFMFERHLYDLIETICHLIFLKL